MLLLLDHVKIYSTISQQMDHSYYSLTGETVVESSAYLKRVGAS